MKKNLFVAFCCIGFTNIVHAQPYVDLFKTKYQYFPQAEFSGDSKNKVSSAQWSTSFFLPIETKRKNDVILAFDYSLIKFSVTGDSSFTSTLASRIAYLGYNKQWKNEKWKTLFMAQVKLNNHSTSTKSRDYQAGGIVLFDYQKKKNLHYHFGAYYSREYFGDFFIPLLGIDWRIDSTLSLFGDIPNSLNLEKKISEKFHAGVSFTSCIASFRADNNLLPDDYVREGDKFWGHNEIKVYMNLYLTKHLVLCAEAGRTVGRIYETYRGDEVLKVPHIAFNKAADSFLISGGIAYRFQVE